ncbi:dipeptidase [Arsenicicoccus piscis]|uniref:Membrane dipeptidase n=1 Tax=Arsenicicoccus piscis TaxID=673954 RepID=A0ABQ6HNV0_9MICO|nr:dipeptidase [Arsenicicoccus piscis]MCH8628810.1 dipeptidase [Arsenicicoccus piscis]GMA20143.1 membrane dipeptidase [Arsenicicoccus piscis]
MLERVRRVLADHPLIDGHNDLPWAARSRCRYDWAGLALDQRVDGLQTDLVRAAEGGLGAQFWSVFVPATLGHDEAVTATLEQVDAVHELVAAYPDHLGLATTADELEAVWRSGRIASLLGAEGGQSIADSLGTLRALYRLGVRYLTLTHNHTIGWADSATDEARHGGLTAFGMRVVREMNRLGMLVDLSHVSADVMRDALRVSAAPVIFSHSSARAVCDHPRNVPDDVLATMASAGGVCQVTFVPKFVSPAVAGWNVHATEAAVAAGVDPRDWVAFTDFTHTYSVDHPQPSATIDDVVAHVEHVREVAGVRHVGLGGDYDGTREVPVGLEDVSGYPRLLARLAERGWSDADLAALAGGNVLRVLRDAEAVAADLQQHRSPDRTVATPE